MKHLFLLIPNNSGSSLVLRLLARSPHAACLRKEGQHLPGYMGPVPGQLGVKHLFGLHEAFDDPGSYDWPAIRELFERRWEALDPNAPVRVEKSPPNVLRAEMLDEHFENTHFIVSWRNPYAAADGIFRGNPGARPGQAARHLIRMLQAARANRERYGERVVAAAYEAIVAAPQGFLDRVTAMIPEIGALEVDPEAEITVKGRRYDGIRDTNAEQIANLTPNMIAGMNRHLERHAELLESFGYGLLPPSAGQARGQGRGRERPRLGRLKGDFNLRKLGSFDVTKLIEQLGRMEDEWPKMDWRQSRYGPHLRTECIPVLWNTPPEQGLVRTEEEVDRHHQSAFAPLVEELAERMRTLYGPGWFLRMILVRLPAGGTVEPHRDLGRSFNVSHRLHIPVVTNDGVRFTVGGETCSLGVGEMWEINNLRPHAVVNEGEGARVHLIFDWYNPDEEEALPDRTQPA